jgi:3-deoxy-D-manno-octulosonic-acid transferase
VKVSLPYRLAVSAGVRLVPLIKRDQVNQRAHAGRLAAPERLERWGREERDPTRPLVWMHAASVGEGLQGREVLAELLRRRPDIQTVATRFSASAERLADTMPADLTGYLPYDRGADVERVLTALKPDLLFFAKLDLWPRLSTEAANRGCPVALVAGTVDPDSTRLRWPGRQLARPGYSALTAIAANGMADVERLVHLGAIRERVVVTGDPRVDSTLAAIDTLKVSGEVDPNADPHTMVAGSTWPEDEAVILESMALVKRAHTKVSVIMVPHESGESRSSSVERAAAAQGLLVVHWDGEGEIPQADVVLVTRMGILARLYSLGGLSYVGGGFGGRGVHSVIEPAGWGRPVVIGPHDRGMREARLLREAGALHQLPTTKPAQALAAQWSSWLSSEHLLKEASQAAVNALAADRGAAGRAAALLEPLLPAPNA